MNIEKFEKIIREMIRNEVSSTMIDEEEYDIHQDYRAGGLSWEEYQDALADYRRRHPEENPEFRRPRRHMSAFDRRWQHVQPGQSAPLKGGPPQAPAPTSTADAKKAMLQQVVKYKNTDGTEGEATVASLLKYPTDHPGRKAAARIYAQFMAKTGQSRPRTEGTELCEGENCEETTHTIGTKMNAHDKLKQIVREEIKAALHELMAQSAEEDTPSVSLQNPAPATAPVETDKELDEKSVPEPYNRNSPPRRKMSKGQIEKRDGIGKRMLKNKKMVAKFQKAHGQDWRSYLWAAASAAALRTKK